MAVLVISKEKTFIPRFNGNRDEPKETQCVVRYKNPTIDLKNQIITTPVAVGEYDEDGKSKGLKVEIKQNDEAMVRRMTINISNLGYQEEEGGDVTWIKTGADLLKAPVTYDPLIKELVELYSKELNATGVSEKN